MNILQKEDLAAASFANTNANATGGVAIRTDAGSTVGAAITAATPAAQTLSIAGQTLSLSGGGGSIAVPSTAFATPAETIAGLVTGKAVDPADLTAKLANQPASGACTDREDVVWNGTVLQGAAKHYSIPRTVLQVTAAPVNLAAGVYLNSVDLNVTNPSSCRAMRLTFDDISGSLFFSSLAPGRGNVYGLASVNGSFVMAGSAGTVADAGASAYTSNFSKSVFLMSGSVDIAPGATALVTMALLYSNNSGQDQAVPAYNEIFATAAFTGQTI